MSEDLTGKIMNCWEFKNCTAKKECPAYQLKEGRFCAHVKGTKCGGKEQGTYVAKLPACMDCEYYQSPHYDKQRLVEMFLNTDFNGSC